MKKISAVALLSSLLALLSPAQASISLDMVTVGNAGNAADSLTGLGSVGYEYKIGTYEVTIAQYTVFLNAVAAGGDPHNLYNVGMAGDAMVAGIQKTPIVGQPGFYSYSVIGDGNRPITYVDWFDAARFVNWLHNNQPSGTQNNLTTEDGAYALNGASSGVAYARKVNALYWLPSADEWYKAAYHLGGSSYSLYPNQSNDVPSNDTDANFFSSNEFDYSLTPGDDSGDNPGGYLTSVGTFSGAASYYGTFDQGGNVEEWNDTVYGALRGLRGGSWDAYESLMESGADDNSYPTTAYNYIGFRVAGSTIPEPTSAVLFGAGLLALVARRRR